MLEANTLEKLKTMLLEKKAKLENDLSKIAEEKDGDYQAEFKDFGREMEDNAEEIEEFTANASITETLEKELNEINAALERMKAGTYGKCDNCQEEIPVERLMAYPAAKTCLKCQKQQS